MGGEDLNNNHLARCVWVCVWVVGRAEAVLVCVVGFISVSSLVLSSHFVGIFFLYLVFFFSAVPRNQCFCFWGGSCSW